MAVVSAHPGPFPQVRSPFSLLLLHLCFRCVGRRRPRRQWRCLRLPMLSILLMLSDSLVGGDASFDGVSVNTTFLLSTTLFVFALQIRYALVSWLYPQSLPSQDLSSSFLVCVFGVRFDVYESPGADGPEVLHCRLLPTESLVRVHHVERRMRCPVRQVRRGEH